MKLVAVKCPECGATVRPPENAERLRCEYCGMTSVVRRRTRILELPVAPVKAPPYPANMPVAMQVHSRRWVAMTMVIPIVLVGLISVVGFVLSRAGITPMAKAERRYGWWSSGVILADVNGDGTPDPVGKIFYAVKDSAHVAAFDGATGERLWQTPKLGDSSDSGTFLTLSGGTIVMANSIGKLYGYAAADGKQLWSASLTEAPSKSCAAESPDSLIVVTADDARHRVAVADGSITTEPATEDKRPCRPVETDARDTAGAATELASADHWDHAWPPYVGDVYVSYHLRPVGSDVTYAFGTRKQGSNIPMLAAFRTELPDKPDGEPAYTVLWEMEVPARDPLTAYTSAPVRAAVDDQAVYVVYDMKKGPHRLASFGRADGARRWDVAAPDEDLDWIFALRSTGEHVYLSDSMRLEVFDAATGAHVRTVADGTW
jgi:DNA-directed RNA polymerase subunit RPC12/RpoP